MRCEVLHCSYSPDLALSDFWLFAAFKKRHKGIHFMCDEKFKPFWEWFCEQLEDFCSGRRETAWEK
jgi:hypothetical protein